MKYYAIRFKTPTKYGGFEESLIYKSEPMTEDELKKWRPKAYDMRVEERTEDEIPNTIK